MLISTHTCHPSLCNDNLSGIAVATMLAKEIGQAAHRLSYRFVFVPATIGSITWLALNEDAVSRIRHGLVLTGLGDSGAFTYKCSRREDADVDRAAVYALKKSGEPFTVVGFDPFGYDERQYCSPGFNLPVGRLSRTLYGTYPEYHTSADDLSFVDSKRLEQAAHVALQVIHALEANQKYVNLSPKGELQLGRRDVHFALWRGRAGVAVGVKPVRWGPRLLEIADKSGVSLGALRNAAERLVSNNLLKVLPNDL